MNQGMTGSQDHARAVDLGPGGLIPTLETQTAQPQKKKRWPQNNAITVSFIINIIPQLYLFVKSQLFHLVFYTGDYKYTYTLIYIRMYIICIMIHIRSDIYKDTQIMIHMYVYKKKTRERD